MVEHPVQLGEGGAQPDRALGHLDAHQPLDGEHDPQLVAEGARASHAGWPAR